MSPKEKTDDLTLGSDPQQFGIPEVLFTQDAVRTRPPLIKVAGWAAEPYDLSPLLEDEATEVVMLVEQSRNGQAAFLRWDGLAMSVQLQNRSLHAKIAGDEEGCARALALLQERFPEQRARDMEVPFSFWTHSQRGPRLVPRPLTVCGWSDIAGNYSQATKNGLDSLMDGFRPAHGGQLLLWHGEPGTGKTFAIRALAWEWRSWCDFHYIVDPDKFFELADYMMAVLLQDYEVTPYNMMRDGKGGARWRTLILEDTGEMIAADAKARVGQGLSRLLNVVDGLIGQGLRILVLLTTNEELGRLDPALSRPGRCASQLEFTRLDQKTARSWLKEHGYDESVSPSGQMRVADLYALTEGYGEAPPVERKIGFGA